MAVSGFMNIGSGLPLEELLAKERQGLTQRLNPYLQKQTSFQGQISAWGSISSSLNSLKTNLEKLQDEGFNGVSVGTNKAFKATAGSGAIPNSYQIAVEKLASAHQLQSAEQDSRTKQLGSSADSRTLTIDVGDSGKPLTVELKKDETSLDQIAKKINAQNGDVIAEVVALGDDKFKLMLTSKKTGEAGEMTVTTTDSTLDSALGLHDKTAPQNAVVYLNGDRVERSSNTISDLITGVTLELREISEKDPDDPDKFKPETLAVTADTSKVKSLIEEFVKNYNSYLSTAAKATKYTAPDRNSLQEGEVPTAAADNGALLSDGTLRRLTSQLKSTATGDYTSTNDVFQTLGKLGITVKFEEVKEGEQRSGALGTLSIDSKKLDEALKNNPKEVEALFLGKDGQEGLKGRMEGIFDTYLGDKEALPKKEGAIETALASLREKDSRNAKQISAVERRIEETLKRREKEYQRLDAAMNQMNTMSQQLQSALAGLV